MPSRLFDPLRSEVDGIRSLRSDFEKSLSPLVRLAGFDAESKSRQAELLNALLDDPSDVKKLNAYRGAVAVAGADRELFAAAHARINDARQRFAAESVETYVVLIRAALALVDQRMEAEGFGLSAPVVEKLANGKEYTNDFGAGQLIEIGGEGIPFPNRQMGEHLFALRQSLINLLSHRTVSPQSLETVLGLIETSPV